MLRLRVTQWYLPLAVAAVLPIASTSTLVAQGEANPAASTSTLLAQGEANPFTSSADMANGARIFRPQCARCHGRDGTGGNGPDLTRGVYRYISSDASLFDLDADTGEKRWRFWTIPGEGKTSTPSSLGRTGVAGPARESSVTRRGRAGALVCPVLADTWHTTERQAASEEVSSLAEARTATSSHWMRRQASSSGASAWAERSNRHR